MIDKIVRHVRKRWEWVRWARALPAIRDLDVFYELTDTRQPGRFRYEERFDRSKRRVADAILDGYELDVADCRVLDIGPGFGQFLDAARDRGALTVGFDYDPFIVRWLQLRGHIAVRGNLLRSVAPLHGQLFEVINLDGALIADYFSLVGFGSLHRVLQRIESVCAPGGRILIRPYFEPTGPKRTPKIADPPNCAFSQTMLACGYTILPTVPQLHTDPALPITYGRTLPSAAPVLPRRAAPVAVH